MTNHNRTHKPKKTMPKTLSVVAALQLVLGATGSMAFAQDASPMLHNDRLPISASSHVPAEDLVQALGSIDTTSTVKTEPETKVDLSQTVPLLEEAIAGEKVNKAKADLKNVLSLGPVPTAPTAPQTRVQIPADAEGVIVIDNDEEVETQETIKYEEMPTDEGKTKIKAGARFPVVMQSQLTSKTAKKGDVFQARLKYDLKIGDRLVAKKGSLVTGHINYVLKARTVLGSIVTTQRFYRNSGVLGFQFDEIVNENSEHIPLVAMPARMARIVKNKYEGRELGVNHNGQVTGPWSQQLRYKAIRIGLNFALAPAGVFSFGAMPVALGVIGAANPSFAFMKPVGLNVRHRRLKGFAWGFLSGIPGSWLIEDTTCRGQEAIIKPGDEFLAEMNQEFTGEPSTDAMLVPGASTKVRGQVMDGSKPKSKK